jgi:hypothetical protein
LVLELAIIFAFPLVGTGNKSIGQKIEFTNNFKACSSTNLGRCFNYSHSHNLFLSISPTAGTNFLKVMIMVYWLFTGFEISAMPADGQRQGIWFSVR